MITLRFSPLLALTLLLPVSVNAETELTDVQQEFLSANVLGIFYHELGHALIDVQNVPIFGQEEDAADVLSAFLIDALFDEETAQSIAFDAAYGYLTSEDTGEDIPFWDVHGPDEQRFYNHVCIFYGANPDAREEFAKDLDLPQERAEYCPSEYDQAANAWGGVLDGMINQDGEPMKFVPAKGEYSDILNPLLSNEVDSLNADFGFAAQITVTIDDCGEPNAFYDPQTRGITFCREFAPYLLETLEAFSQ